MFAGSPFVLRVPIDVSQVCDFTPGRRIGVLLWNRQGYQQWRPVTFETQDIVTVTFNLEQAPESLRVTLGPEAATTSDLRHLQTTSLAVPCSTWRVSSQVELPTIRVSAWDWWWWDHWRQNFRVTGRLIRPDGRPVAGATVSASDIDAWWWWTAQEQVGTTVTDRDGAFRIEFTRCCGWWPSWWWSNRDWQVDAALAEKITSFVRQYPGLAPLAPAADSVPSLEVFQPLLSASARPLPSTLAATLSRVDHDIDPAALEQIRERLVEILPRRFPLPVWPWSKWSPWEDCGANLIFRATQSRGETTTAVLVNESVASARWDIPRVLNVTLIAREPAFFSASAHWTLVDYLFPQSLSMPICQKQSAPPTRTLPPVLSNSGAYRIARGIEPPDKP
ncbi:MAG TPA: carboxypeptidase-like regulatory domain-containing protein [Acidobacteriaceae bacterium]|jgi:hypothetical protein|nr:carboxypeptidase-like regulatory domain-containing protein [Acidobacteriaceae bacterium]